MDCFVALLLAMTLMESDAFFDTGQNRTLSS